MPYDFSDFGDASNIDYGDNNYVDAYRQNRFSPVDMSNTPAYKKYQDLLGQTSPGLKMVQDQMGAKPVESDYEPNLARKLLAAVSGFSAGIHNPGAGISAAQGIIDEPYESAYKKWQGESSIADKQAALLDAEYTKRLQAAGNDVHEERLRQGLAERTQKDQTAAKAKQQQEDITAGKDAATLQDRQTRTGLYAQALADKNTRATNALAAKGKDKTPTNVDYDKEMKAQDDLDVRLEQHALKELKDDPTFSNLIQPETMTDIHGNEKPTGRLAPAVNEKDYRYNLLKKAVKDKKAILKGTIKPRFQPIEAYVPGQEEDVPAPPQD